MSRHVVVIQTGEEKERAERSAQFGLILLAIQRSSLADNTKKQYENIVGRYEATGGKIGDAAAVADFAQTLPSSSRAFFKAAISKFAKAEILRWKGEATPANIDVVQAAVFRLEALAGAIKIKKAGGEKLGTWLSPAEVKKLVSTAVSLRDKVAIGLLVSAGLRRHEAVGLTFGDVVSAAQKGQVRQCLNVQGKGGKGRVVPISEALANDIERLRQEEESGAGDRVLQNRARNGRRGSLSAVALLNIVRTAGAQIGRAGLAPHDLRRTYAQIGYDAGIPLTQISRLLGHASVATTQRYLNTAIDFEATISDFVPY